MTNSKSKALDAKTKYKEGQSKARKYFRDKGYTTVKSKTYYDYNTKDRANIRKNSKPGSGMHNWARADRSHKGEGHEPNRQSDKEWTKGFHLPF